MSPGKVIATTVGAVLCVSLFPYLTLAALNPQDLSTPFSDYLESGYLWIVLAIAIFAATLGLLLVRRFPKSWSAIAAVLVALTVCVYLQSNLLVWDYGVMDGSKFKFGGKKIVALVELAVWLGVFGGALLWRRQIAKVAPQIILSIVVLQGASVGWALANSPPDRKPIKARGAPQLSANRNIIIFISDGLQGDIAEELLNSRATKLRDALQGFTFFSNAISHHRLTLFSLPSLLTGQPFFGTEDYESFSKRQEERNIGRALQAAGFDTFMISEPRYCAGLTRCVYRWSLTRPPTLLDKTLARIVNLTGFRAVPHVLKRKAFDGVKGVGDMLVTKGGMWGSGAMEVYFYNWLVDNLYASTEEPVFAVFHNTASHHPYVLDADCQAREVRMNESGMMDQYVCEMSLFSKFIERLKALGIYDTSLIFWLSDHGARAAFLHGDDERQVVSQDAHATLAVKPPGAKGPLSFSTAPVSLSDVAFTIAEEAGIKTPKYEGTSLLRDVPAARDRYFVWSPLKKPSRFDLKTYRLRGDVSNPQDWARSPPPKRD